MIIREFNLNDIPRVYEIERMSFEDPYDVNVLEQLFDFGAGFLIAQINGYVVGYIIFWINSEDKGHIISLAVDKNYKRQKIGSKLIKRAIATFIEFDIFTITLEVRAKSIEAVDFYEAVGFKKDRFVSNYYEDGADAFKMSLNFLDEENVDNY